MAHITEFSPAVALPAGPIRTDGDQAIRTDAVYVVYTSFDDTLAALRAAGGFAKALQVPVRLVHVRTVPYALSLDQAIGISPVETDAFMAHLQSDGLDLDVRVHPCRSLGQAIRMAFKAHSLVVLAGRAGWWPTVANRWRKLLTAAGHFVVFVEKRSSHA